jgi:hypothetical protein
MLKEKLMIVVVILTQSGAVLSMNNARVEQDLALLYTSLQELSKNLPSSTSTSSTPATETKAASAEEKLKQGITKETEAALAIINDQPKPFDRVVLAQLHSEDPQKPGLLDKAINRFWEAIINNDQKGVELLYKNFRTIIELIRKTEYGRTNFVDIAGWLDDGKGFGEPMARQEYALLLTSYCFNSFTQNSI